MTSCYLSSLAWYFLMTKMMSYYLTLHEHTHTHKTCLIYGVECALNTKRLSQLIQLHYEYGHKTWSKLMFSYRICDFHINLLHLNCCQRHNSPFWMSDRTGQDSMQTHNSMDMHGIALHATTAFILGIKTWSKNLLCWRYRRNSVSCWSTHICNTTWFRQNDANTNTERKVNLSHTVSLLMPNIEWKTRNKCHVCQKKCQIQ